MKKLLFTILFLMSTMTYGQTKISVVKLKNGTELKGVIKSIDPMDSMILSIGGVETTIKMDNVQSVEEISNTSESPTIDRNDKLSNDKLEVTDNSNYPETFEIKVGENTIKMILVRGGNMKMGYDGPGSLSMKSEPVHNVSLTSFYMSEIYIPDSVAKFVQGKKSSKGYYKPLDWKKADLVARLIAESTGLKLRLPTEAEWEYAACSPVQHLIFNTCKGAEYCSDYYKDFDMLDGEIDPKGPQKGSRHVSRVFTRKNETGFGVKFDRTATSKQKYMRLVIKVKDAITQ